MSDHKTRTATRKAPSANPKAKPRTRRTTSVPAHSGQADSPDAVISREDAPSDAPDVKADINVLIEVANNTRRNAYVPYSGYRVGAALLTSSGAVYGGCNVENAAYGVSICAERAAVVKAVSRGERDFDAIVVVTDDGATPCGECRQVLSEFGTEIVVILADKRGRYTVTTVGDLLPDAFTLSHT